MQLQMMDWLYTWVHEIEIVSDCKSAFNSPDVCNIICDLVIFRHEGGQEYI